MEFTSKILAIKHLRTVVNDCPLSIEKNNNGDWVVAKPYIGLKDAKDFVEACTEMGKIEANAPKVPVRIWILTQTSIMSGTYDIQERVTGYYVSYDAAYKALKKQIEINPAQVSAYDFNITDAVVQE